MADSDGLLQVRSRTQSQKLIAGNGKMHLSLFFKILIILFCLILISLIGYGTYLFFQLRSTTLAIGTDENVRAEDRADVKPITLLILGTDYREQTRTANTDVIMLITMNPINKTATLVSIPRDTYVKPSDIKGNKANSFYAAFLYSNSFKSAPQDKIERQGFAMDRIKLLFSEFLDISIDYVTIMNFQAFVDVIDAFGGLEIEVDQDMCHKDSADGSNINLNKGLQTLNGKNSLDFVRYRQSMNCDPKTEVSSDFERNLRQQLVLSQLVEKVKSPKTLTKVENIFRAVEENVHTDLPAEQIQAIMQTYVGISQEKIKFVGLKGNWDGHYVRINKDDITQASNSLKNQLILEKISN
jgi:LCP family protein required for cell wall assembly